MFIPEHVYSERQGALLKIKSKGHFDPPLENGTSYQRGTITHFSRRSRKRMLEMFCRLRFKSPLFVTLTFPKNHLGASDAKEAKRALHAFAKRLKRVHENISIVWRIERQASGRIHFHLVVMGAGFIPWQAIRIMWAAILGHITPLRERRLWALYKAHAGRKTIASWRPRMSALATDVQAIKSRHKLISYVSKYMGKTENPQSQEYGSETSLDYEPYLAALGRTWGVIFGDNLPFAPLMEESLGKYEDIAKPFEDARRAFARLSGIQGKKIKGIGFTMLFNERRIEDMQRYLMLLLTT
jgi:hypothetical protein